PPPCLMLGPPPLCTQVSTLFPYTPLFRSAGTQGGGGQGGFGSTIGADGTARSEDHPSKHPDP
ncbi:hypothetical protein PJK57_29125, partial [Mycobacterium kansasii]